MNDYNEQLGIKSIKDFNKDRIGDKIKKQLGWGWIFEQWYEKMILVILCAFGVWKIVGFFR